MYDLRFDGNYHDIQNIFGLGSITHGEAYQLGNSLADDGLIKLSESKTSIYAQITGSGIEFIEEDEVNRTEYNPKDSFTTDEEKETIKRIDELGQQLRRLEIGQQIIYDDLLDEFEELKRLVAVLGKKNWLQVLKGKLVDLGFGKIADQVEDLIIETFNDQKFLNG